MNFKFKKSVCFVCTLIIVFTVLVVPVSASDFDLSEYKSKFDYGELKYYDVNTYFALKSEEKLNDEYIISQFNKTIGYDITEYNYFYYVFQYQFSYSNKARYLIEIFIFEKDDEIMNNTFTIPPVGEKTNYNSNAKFQYLDVELVCPDENYVLYYNGSPTPPIPIQSDNVIKSSTYGMIQGDNAVGYSTNFPSLKVGNINIGVENPPVPFTVTYTHELSDDMKNVVYIPSKGGANADENGNVEQQLDSFKLTVTLTDEYIALLNKYPDLNKHTYEFIVYITTEPPETVGYSQSANKAVYTDVHYGYYMYTTSGVVADVTDDYNEPTNWIKAQGVNIGYIIPKGQKSKTVDINLQNVDTSKLEKNQHLYCVVYGRQTLLDYPTPDYFNVANQESLCKGELNSTITYVIEDDDDNDPNNNIEVVAPDYYCATSEPFYFSEYPEYSPKHFENGEIYDTNKGVFAYTDKKIAPDKMWDFDMASKGDNGLTPDEFKVYEDNKKLSENYQSFKFDTTDLSSIFTEGTDFFRFLTTSISILPSYFMTILISFFTIFLAIVLIKFVF